MALATWLIWGVLAAGGNKPAEKPVDPDSWKLSQKMPRGSAARAALVAEWGAKTSAPGEEPLTRDEADKILDDARAEVIYGSKTVAIVAPSMLARQKQEHTDLLALFLKPERIAAGVTFYREHKGVLEQAEAHHKVDPSVIVSILLWESNLGTRVGEYFAFNVFTSQAFFVDDANAVALSRKSERAVLDPDRQARRVDSIRSRARANLSALVRSCKAKSIDPLTVKGSWAGALGYPQFMPASLRWAEDGNGDGNIDLYTFDDSIASIGRYLEAHGFAKSRSNAVWEYNHEAAYVKGVLAYADALTAKLKEGEVDGGATGSDAGTADAAHGQ